MARTFTHDEAQDLLPVLEGLLRKAIGAKKRLQRLEQEFAALKNRITVCGGLELDIPRLARRRAEQDRAAQALKDALREIEASGVQVKDLEIGLLDFPCVVGERVILLCWRLGEKQIGHWHSTDEGYSSRKVIDDRLLRAQARKRPS